MKPKHRFGPWNAALATSIAATVLLLIPTVARAQTPIPLEDAITAIEATENRVHSYAWSFHFTRNQLSDPTDPTSIVETGPGYYKGFCLYDVSEGKYLLEFEYVSEWHDGAAPYIAGRQGWSFDGREYRHWGQSRHGMELPPLDDVGDGPRDPAIGPLTGDISLTPQGNPDQAEMNLRVSGLQHLPPHAYSWSGEGHRIFSRLSERLRQHQHAEEDVQVTELPDAIWCIEVRESDGSPGLRRFFVDPARGFVLTGAEYHYSESVFRRVVTTVEEVAEGVWAPMEIISYNLVSGSADRIVLSELEVNPELADEDFRVLFPAGTQVYDLTSQNE